MFSFFAGHIFLNKLNRRTLFFISFRLSLGVRFSSVYLNPPTREPLTSHLFLCTSACLSRFFVTSRASSNISSALRFSDLPMARIMSNNLYFTNVAPLIPQLTCLPCLKLQVHLPASTFCPSHTFKSFQTATYIKSLLFTHNLLSNFLPIISTFSKTLPPPFSLLEWSRTIGYTLSITPRLQG